MTKRILKRGVVCAAFLAVTLISHGQYSLVKLDGISNVFGAWLNNKDQVVSGSQLWDAGVVTELPGLGGGFTAVQNINDLGQIVGRSQSADNLMNAVVWQNGVVTRLSSLSANSNSYATGINDSGQITGYAGVGAELHATYWKNLDASPVDIGTLPGHLTSFGEVINNHGVIAGISRPRSTAGYDYRGFIYTGGELTQFGLPGASDMSVEGINDAGVIVGYRGFKAYFFDGSLHEIETLGGSFGTASGVNAYGEIIGRSTDANQSLHPFLYKNGSLIDLDSLFRSAMPSNISLQVAWDINDRGDILLSDNQNSLYIARLNDPHPIPSLTPVPEPATFGVFAATGLLGLVLKRRRGMRPQSRQS